MFTKSNSSNVQRDFGYQYLQYLDKLIKEYITTIHQVNSNYLLFNDYSIERVLEKIFFANFIYNQQLRDYFNTYFIQERFENEFKELFYNKAFKGYLVTKPFNNKNDKELRDLNIKSKIIEILSPHKGKILYYAYNLRFLEIIIPLLAKLEEPVIVLTFAAIPENKKYPDNIVILEVPVFKIGDYKNPFLKEKFSTLYYLLNSLDFLIDILSPKSIMVIEGANVVEYNLLALIGKKYKINTICIQHGWPGIMYSGFKGMEFDFFLSWGKEFSKLLIPENPSTKFTITGYPYSIPDLDKTSKKSITFFFQGPYFVSNRTVIDQMLDFAIFCADNFPELEILIREHPSHKFNQINLEKTYEYKNIKFVPSKEFELNIILSKTLVSVSVFSSTLMESIIYDSIPFIFNLTSMPNYFPDLQKEGLGIEIKSMDEAKRKIIKLIKSPKLLSLYQARISANKQRFFECSGEKAIQNIVQKVQKISN